MSEIVKLVNQNEMLSPNQVVHVMQIAHKVFFFLFFFYTEKHDNSLTLFYQNILKKPKLFFPIQYSVSKKNKEAS